MSTASSRAGGRDWLRPMHVHISTRACTLYIRVFIHSSPPSYSHANSVLERGRAWCVGQPLDVPSMERAAEALVGRHDFSSFRGRDCQAK